MNTQSSKEKIMKAAKSLFGLHGFKGTSIRMIAEKAKVNVASINYYFTSKETLFYEVLLGEAIEVGVAMTSAYQESDNFVAMSVRLFQKLFEKPEQTTSCLKLLLSMERLPDDGVGLSDQQRELILSGHGLLENKLKEELGEKISADSLSWAADVMSSSVLQMVLMGSSVFIQNLIPEKSFSMEELSKKIERLAHAVLSDLKGEMK